MAEATITFLLENVQKLLEDDIHLISGAERELKMLQNELELMKAFLEDSANKREKGEVFRQYEKQIREVVYKAEDTLDVCLTEVAAQNAFRLKFLNPKRISLARKIKDLREQEVQPVFDRARKGLVTLPTADASSSGIPYYEHQKFPMLREDNVVGFEDVAETLINNLCRESDELEAISITGMPGLGKTTLARKIYCDNRIQYEFQTLIWIYVSQDFRRRDVFLTILKKVSREDMSSLTDLMLADIVRQCLKNIKFLLILDSVHTVEDWKDIEAVLPKRNRLGKVLIASHHEEVAYQANSKREPHRLRFLNADESWELLQLEVFGELGKCPSELEGLGKQIALQCDGLPLAIVVIGGVLVKKFSGSHMKDVWEKVSASVSTYLNDDMEKRMENIIALIYNKLPHDLRDCFLYLGMFPKDSEIPAWKLIRLWIAEGFIKRKSGMSLEEVAENNLKDLKKRNLVMVYKKMEGGIKMCRVTNMIHEFCKIEAAIARHNLFQEVKRSTEGVFDPPISEILKCRRLCIHTHVMDFLRKQPKGPWVRSFLCFSKENIILPAEFIPSIPNAFNLLRVLDVSPIKFTRFPTRLSNLIHLRYIALSGDDFKVLPEAISKLWHLQTIRIDTTCPTFEIKANIWKMMQLRHLKTKAAIILNSEVKGEAGENLQTLSRLSAQCCTEDVFNRAPNLKNLGIRGRLGTLLEGKSLEKLDRLQKLKLVHDVFPTATSEGPLLRLPQPDRFPPNLRILKLSSTFLDWGHMATLGMLRTLEVLKLKQNAFIGRLWQAVDSGFPSLESLHIAHTDLEVWTATGHSFPKLRCLVLKYCNELQEIPSVLEKNLQILDLDRVSKPLVAYARGIEKKKQEMQGQQNDRSRGFKLTIALGDGWQM